MSWLKWNSGRQNTGYQKMLLLAAKWPLKFDCYLLRYKTGAYIPAHKDLVTQGRHFRLNIILKQAKSGGKFHCQELIWDTSRIKLFCPDLFEHSLTEIVEGSRYVLSIGWVKS